MAKVSETYTGTYLSASELPPGKRSRAVVHAASVEEIGQDRAAKIVLAVTTPKGQPWSKEIVLNKTNALQMKEAFGDDTDDWLGRHIEVWSEAVMFQGKMVQGIKVQPTLSAAGNGRALAWDTRAAPGQASPPPGSDIEADEIPF